jgi:hypothetical protein
LQPAPQPAVFKGRITLTVEHVISVLTAVGVKPADFFASFYGIEPGPIWRL